MDPLKMYFLLNMGIFHCYVSLPEGNPTYITGDFGPSPLDHQLGSFRPRGAIARPYLHASMLELLFEPSEVLAQRHQEADGRSG